MAKIIKKQNLNAHVYIIILLNDLFFFSFFCFVFEFFFYPIFVVSVAVELVVESFRPKLLANSFRIRWTVELPSAEAADGLCEVEVSVAVVEAVEALEATLLFSDSAR